MKRECCLLGGGSKPPRLRAIGQRNWNVASAFGQWAGIEKGELPPRRRAVGRLDCNVASALEQWVGIETGELLPRQTLRLRAVRIGICAAPRQRAVWVWIWSVSTLSPFDLHTRSFGSAVASSCFSCGSFLFGVVFGAWRQNGLASVARGCWQARLGLWCSQHEQCGKCLERVAPLERLDLSASPCQTVHRS